MRNKKEVERRVKILTFWKEHGLQATTDAFSVSRRTLFRWKKALDHSQGKLNALDPKTTTPKNTRKRIYPPGYLEKVIQLREDYGRLGKKTLAELLNVSESYAGRTLTDLKERGLLSSHKHVSLSGKTGRLIERTKAKKQRKRRLVKQGMELDSIVRFVNGTRRYVITAIDVETRFAFAAAYTTHSSTTAADFLDKLRTVTPYPITQLQTDNGSEFQRYFEESCKRHKITHFHTYPRSPKMNAHVERFNRTISEGFIMRKRSLLAHDLSTFNDEMVTWLLWYNTERPHQSLEMKTPLSVVANQLSKGECRKWWTSTKSLLFVIFCYDKRALLVCILTTLLYEDS